MDYLHVHESYFKIMSVKLVLFKIKNVKFYQLSSYLSIPLEVWRNMKVRPCILWLDPFLQTN